MFAELAGGGLREGAGPMTSARQRHWRSNLRVTSLLLLVWLIVTFGVSYFARELSFSFFGWPFSFWVGAQGALVIVRVQVALPEAGLQPFVQG